MCRTSPPVFGVRQEAVIGCGSSAASRCVALAFSAADGGERGGETAAGGRRRVGGGSEKSQTGTQTCFEARLKESLREPWTPSSTPPQWHLCCLLVLPPVHSGCRCAERKRFFIGDLYRCWMFYSLKHLDILMHRLRSQT